MRRLIESLLTMATFKKYWYIWVAIILIIIFRKKIMSFFGIGTPETPLVEGSACKTKLSVPGIIGWVTLPGAAGTIKNGVCVANPAQSSMLGKKLKVIDVSGIPVLELNAQGCPAFKATQVLIPQGTESEILEVKNIAIEQCSNVEKIILVRTADGWFTVSDMVQII